MTRLVSFLQDRVIFAKLAAVILWVSYGISIALGPHVDANGPDYSFSGPVVGPQKNAWIVYNQHYGTFNFKGETNGADHLAWYTAARLIREGNADKVYDYGFVARYQNQLIPENRWQSLMAYRNPPFYCLPYLLTCNLPFTLSWFIWNVVYLVGVWFAVRWLGGGGKDYFWVLAFYPTFAAVSYGQNSLISFVLLAATYRLMKADKIFLAGLVAGFLWFKPTMLIGLIVWGLLDIKKLWPAAVGVVVTGLVLTLGSYPFIPEVWDGFVNSLRGNVKFADFEQFKMHNPVAFWRLLLPEAAAWHWPLAGLCSLLAVGWFVRIWQRHRNDLEIVFGAVVFLTLWGSPHALIYEWSVLGVTGVLWWRKLAHVPAARFLLFGASWLVMFLSTHFTELQLDLQGVPHATIAAWVVQDLNAALPRKLNWDATITHYAVQVSVPVLAVVGVIAGRLFGRKP
jgi:hypothetical protein